MADWMEDLKQIAELRDAGVLTDDEFKLAKKRILEARETQTPQSATTSDEMRLSEKENRPTEHSTHSQEPAVHSPAMNLAGAEREVQADWKQRAGTFRDGRRWYLGSYDNYPSRRGGRAMVCSTLCTGCLG